jgi:dTDP-D-glucose 4,6-dehydratase
MKTNSILITGGLGFIGSNYIDCLRVQNPSQNIFVLDKITYAADLKALDRWKENSNINFIKGDICDGGLLLEIFTKNKIQGVVHFAAESHVDNSINGPQSFVETNIMGTFQLLEAARKTWLDGLFVTDHCKAIQTVFEKGTLGEVYIVGGDNEKTNLEICTAVIKILDKQKPRLNGKSYFELITHVKDRPGHDFRYAVDASKIKKELGWLAKTSFEDALETTVLHYLRSIKTL